jgi:tight adherence protein C
VVLATFGLTVLLLGGLILTGIAVTLVIRAGTAPRARTSRNLDHIGHYGFATATVEETRPRSRLLTALDASAGRLGEFISGRLRLFENQDIKNSLIAAGFYATSARNFIGYRILSLIGAILLWLWITVTGQPSVFLTVLGFVLAPVVGWMGPVWFLRERARRRLAQIDYELPELIDLLVVTVEAGVGFAASLQIAVARLPGPLGDELRLVIQEQTMGLGMNDALRHMLDRCDTPAVRSFVRSILQGETLGVSIGQIMRNLAAEMRKRRRAAAEERAQKAPIKMLFPLVFLIFPSMFVVLLGPAIYSFVKAIGS